MFGARAGVAKNVALIFSPGDYEHLTTAEYHRAGSLALAEQLRTNGFNTGKVVRTMLSSNLFFSDHAKALLTRVLGPATLLEMPVVAEAHPLVKPALIDDQLHLLRERKTVDRDEILSLIGALLARDHGERPPIDLVFWEQAPTSVMVTTKSSASSRKNPALAASAAAPATACAAVHPGCSSSSFSGPSSTHRSATPNSHAPSPSAPRWLRS